MAHKLGLHPWDIDRLTWDQWSRYRQYIDDMIQAQQRG